MQAILFLSKIQFSRGCVLGQSRRLPVLVIATHYVNAIQYLSMYEVRSTKYECSIPDSYEVRN
jgi:hypothetical protein